MTRMFESQIRQQWYLYLALLALVTLLLSDQPAGIDGFVTSDLAAPVPNAMVGVNSLRKGFRRETVTNFSGYYLIDGLNPGAYSMSAEVKGFGCIVYPYLALSAGQRLRQNFHFERAKRNPGTCEPVQKKSE